ncbi:MAG: hypothetical protein WD509_00385 [Candidatus Paceibacterota bacterium]
MKIFYTLFAMAVLFLVGGVWWSNSSIARDPSVVSKDGIHWHPTLSIVIKGELQEIPANIGLVGGHSAIHTHDDVADQRETGSVHIDEKPLHLEFASIVKANDVRLGEFFKVWRKTFSSECILDYCNSDDGSLSMLVNGEVNTEFENYVMKDGDKIEIRYE